jgi:signal transduction histidine kinase
MYTVLVIDDEPASRRAVTRALADECRVLTAASAAEGLALLTSEPVALMIVDQRMPVMSGTELLAQTAVQHPDVIRVLLTGYSGLDTLVDAINQGHVYYYVTKPWEPGELRLVVRRGLESYAAAAERRRLVRELERACQRARREAEQKGRLLALAAHELGTPLHVLSNALVLIGEMDLPPAARTWLDTAERAAAWLGRGLAHLHTAARWGAGTLRLDVRPVDLSPLLLALRDRFEPVAAARALTLHLEMARGLPPLMADERWLERGIANLLTNAVRFTPDGGRITMAARHADAAICISVADTGIGIDASLLEEVFEPFSAAGGDVALHTSGRFEFGSRGLGLGLAITKAVVERHGGTIAVRSERGSGSEFTVTLPLPPQRVSGIEFR